MGDQTEGSPVYFATVAVEPKRWTAERKSSITASVWGKQAFSEGFAGMELWENHYAHASGTERAALVELCSKAPAGCILNTYHTFDSLPQHSASVEGDQNAAVQDPAMLRQILKELPCTGIKFNVGTQEGRTDAYRNNLAQWLSLLKQDGSLARARILCECHPGTIVETPPAAEEFFAGGLLSQVRYIIHPFSIAEGELEAWIGTGRVVHAHIQSREAPLSEIPGAAKRIRHLLAREPNISFGIEFAHTTGQERETPQQSYDAVLADFRFLLRIIREEEHSGDP